MTQNPKTSQKELSKSKQTNKRHLKLEKISTSKSSNTKNQYRKHKTSTSKQTVSTCLPMTSPPSEQKRDFQSNQMWDNNSSIDESNHQDPDLKEKSNRNISFMFKKNNPNLLHNISKISNRGHSLSRVQKHSEGSLSEQDTSKLLRSLSLDDSKSSVDSKYNNYLAEFDKDSEMQTNSRLHSSFNDSYYKDNSNIADKLSSLNITNFSKSFSNILDLSQAKLKKTSLLGVSRQDEEILHLVEQSFDQQDQSSDVIQETKPLQGTGDISKQGNIFLQEDSDFMKHNSSDSSNILEEKNSFQNNQFLQPNLNKKVQKKLPYLNLSKNEFEKNIQKNEDHNIPRQSSFSIENTQRSILSDFSFDENQKESFMKGFGYTKYHEKFFRKKVLKTSSREFLKIQTKDFNFSKNVFFYSNTLKNKTIKKMKQNIDQNESITLKLFNNGTLDKCESKYIIKKIGLIGSEKNSLAKEIVIGREGNKVLPNNLQIHDIPLKSKNRSVSRMHCMIESYFAFSGTFKLTKRILFFMSCLEKMRKKLKLTFKRPKFFFCRFIFFQIFKYLKKSKTVFLYDFNSTTSTFLRLPFSKTIYLVKDLKFMLGDDACFKVVNVLKNQRVESLQLQFPNSQWIGFDDQFLEEIEDMIPVNERSQDSDFMRNSDYFKQFALFNVNKKQNKKKICKDNKKLPTFQDYQHHQKLNKLNDVLILKVSNASSNIKKHLIFKANRRKPQIFRFGRTPENEVNVNLSDISRKHLR